MKVELVRLPAEKLARWLEITEREYVDQLVAAGADPEAARVQGRRSIETMFPEGQPAPGNKVFAVCNAEGEHVGIVWYGPSNQTDGMWIYDIRINEDRQGRGYGKAAMRAVEENLRSEGVTSVGLNVFGSNVVARKLYESLGYEARSIWMSKDL